MDNWIKDFHTLYFSEKKYEEANRIKLEHLPQSLFRYRATSDIPHIIDALKNGKTPSIYLSNPANFNDPYDTRIPVRFENTPLFKKTMGRKLLLEIEKDEEIFTNAGDFKRRFKARKRLYRRNLMDAAKIQDWDSWKKRFLDIIISMIPKRYVDNNELAISLGNELFTMEFSKLRESFTNSIKQNCGVACFSGRDKPNSLTMWGHYAENHKGICLEYKKDEILNLPQSILDDGLFPVFYCDDMQDFTTEFLTLGNDIPNHLLNQDDDEKYPEYKVKLLDFGWENKYVQNFGSQKATAWSNENEWRIIRPIAEDDAQEERFMELPISAIYLGTNISDTDEDILKDTIKDYAPYIKLYNMSMRPDRFELEPHLIYL